MSRESAFLDGYQKFKSYILFYGYFHIGFISFLCIQLLSFLLFFSYFSQSLIAACGLALFFLTLFSYFVLLFFFQAKKPEQLLSIRNEFLHTCQMSLTQVKDSPEYLLTISSSLEEFAAFFNEEEPAFYSSPLPFKALAPLIEKFKIWLHWKNFHDMKELLFLLSAEKLVSLVKQSPTDLEVHANLAGTYTRLSKLYIHPKKLNTFSSQTWISPDYSSPAMQQKFLFYSKKAIEEFKILEEYAPKNPWVYAHLAEIYRLQENPTEEITQCEQLLAVAPENTEVLFRLGVLYFQQGFNAKGLKIYESLQNEFPEKAKTLIEHYDSLYF